MTVNASTPLGRVLHEEGRKQSWLAERLGVDQVQVWRWVRGLHDPVDETKRAIADALGRTVGELFPAHDAAASTTPPAADASTSALGEAA